MNDAYAVKHVARMARENMELIQPAMDALGAAAAGGHLKSICHQAQQELMDLMHQGHCADECAVNAITHLGLVKHKHDLHDDTTMFLMEHASMPHSQYWEPASLMLGALARHTNNFDLVAHAFDQITKLDGMQLSKKWRHHMKRTLLHTLGNAGHAEGRGHIVDHLDDDDELIQLSAAKALANVPPGDLHGEITLAAVGANTKRSKTIRRAACQSLADRDHVTAASCFEGIETGARKLSQEESDAMAASFAPAPPTELFDIDS
jgi:hypothetical protein